MSEGPMHHHLGMGCDLGEIHPGVCQIGAPQPYEARGLPELEGTLLVREAFNNLLTAVNGFPYQGESTNAIVYTLRWLRANPAQADILLGRTR